MTTAILSQAKVLTATRINQLIIDVNKTSGWLAQPEGKRKQAIDRLVVVTAILERQGKGSMRQAILSTLTDLKLGYATKEVTAAALRGNTRNSIPGKSTLHKWCAQYQEQGVIGLIPEHTGRVRKDKGWELRAIQLHQRPQNPKPGQVAFWLQDEGWEVTDTQVRRYLHTMPETLGENSAYRKGADYYRHNLSTFIRRDTSKLSPGDIYQGDGHTIDVYVAHPMTGNLFRPEMTAWIDIASRYIVGVAMSEAENSYGTLCSLSEAIDNYQHIPACVHIDNGSGFKAQMLTDKATGFYGRMGISQLVSLPGNSKGKGHIERWFRTLRDLHDKKFDTYCGHDMAPEINRRISTEAKQGKRVLPSYEQYYSSALEFIDRYNNRVHSALDGKTPAEIWTQLQPVQPHADLDVLVRPIYERTVRRHSVQIFNRQYQAPELSQYSGRPVQVEFHMGNDAEARIFDSEERLICIAALVRKADYIPDSRLVEMKENRRKAQNKRHIKHIDEQNERAKSLITQEHQLKGIDQFEQDYLDGETIDSVDAQIEAPSDDINLDILDEDY